MNSESVLKIFHEITKIPRESGHEEKITAFLQSFAKSHNLECKTDKTSNVLIAKPASKGKENVPVLVLQSHQDMVCEKLAGCTHDFANDPIKYVIEDGWMVAKETTLGADDGIGIAASLALLESDIPMGRIECIFTISEETGMNGAMDMQPGFFTGKTLINLDSEDEGQLFVGCAGGLDTTATFRYSGEKVPEGNSTVELRIFNCAGGHSGDDINKERCNAVRQMARFLYKEICKEGVKLITLNGGNKYNAIAREAEAVISVPKSYKEELIARFNAFGDILRNEFSVSDPDIKVSSQEVEFTGNAIESEVARKLIAVLISVSHGVEAMSQDIPGLVETSTNLAAVKMLSPGEISVWTSQRSSVESAKDKIADMVQAAFQLAGAEVERTNIYPGWKPNLNSKILDVTVKAYKKLFNVEPEVKAIHAGLECGLFLEKFPGLDMISFGPTLRGVHTPGEKLDLASNEKFVKLLVEVVSNFS